VVSFSFGRRSTDRPSARRAETSARGAGSSSRTTYRDNELTEAIPSYLKGRRSVGSAWLSRGRSFDRFDPMAFVFGILPALPAGAALRSEEASSGSDPSR